MSVSLSYRNHRHVSTTHVDNFRVARTRIRLQFWCVGINRSKSLAGIRY